MEIFRIYMSLNIMLVVGAGLSVLMTFLSKASVLNISSKTLVRIQLGILSLCVLATIALPLMPEETFVRPLPQSFDRPLLRMPSSWVTPTTTFGVKPILSPMPTGGTPIAGLLLLVLFGMGLKTLFQVRKTFSTLRRAFPYKSLGRIRIMVSDSEETPYAFSFLRRSYISLPLELLSDMSSFKIAIQHEAQHIRQGDTATIYGLELIRGLCFWNPAVRLWIRHILVEQEFSCDEALIVHKKVSPRNYANCLFEVANLRENERSLPFGATGILFGQSRSLLIRRIKEMKNVEQKSKGIAFGLSMVLASCLFVGFTATALKSMASIGKLSIEKVSSLVKPSDFSKDFPITVNEAVVAELNKMVGTKRGRAFVKKAFANYQNYQSLLNGSIKSYGLPEELLAVGFVESGFRNLPQSPHPMQSAGLWQFIPDTARNYNLRVDDRVDERLNVTLETDAAMRYLSALKLRFKDWQLAVLSYNAGEGRVQRGINHTGQRDAWAVIDAGFGGDKGYLAKVMAGAIVMKYPTLAD